MAPHLKHGWHCEEGDVTHARTHQPGRRAKAKAADVGMTWHIGVSKTVMEVTKPS